MIVVDASLAAKWVLWEQDSLQAMDFLVQRDRELCAPDLLFIEVAGAIVRQANVAKSNDATMQPDAERALRKWTTTWDQHVVKPYRTTQRRLFRAGTLALSLGHPIKDCIYLDLAMEIGADLATCDARFRRKALSAYPAIKLLGEFDN